MKNAKHLILSLFLLFSLNSSNAQIGLRLGLNLANATVKSDGSSIDSDIRIGAGAGIFYQLKLNNNLSIQPEFN